jgi:hypothetical protein
MTDTSPHDEAGATLAEQLRAIVSAPRLHLAFVRPRELQQLRSGVKTCESRLSLRAHPARTTRPGDALLFKSGDVGAAALVLGVSVYSSAVPLDVTALMVRYSRAVDGPVCDLDYWLSKREARHAVFLHLGDVVPLHIGGHLLPSTRSAWIADYDASWGVRQRLRQAVKLASE